MVYIAYIQNKEIVLSPLNISSWEDLKRAGYDSLSQPILNNLFNNYVKVCSDVMYVPHEKLELTVLQARQMDLSVLRFIMGTTMAVTNESISMKDVFAHLGFVSEVYLIVFLRPGDPNALRTSADTLLCLDEHTHVFSAEHGNKYEIGIGQKYITVKCEDGKLELVEEDSKAKVGG